MFKTEETILFTFSTMSLGIDSSSVGNVRSWPSSIEPEILSATFHFDFGK